MEWYDLDWFDQSFLEAKIQEDVQIVNCRGICMDLWQSYTDKNIDFGWEKALINGRLIDSLIANLQVVKIVWWICYDMSKGKTKIFLQIHLVLSVKQCRMPFTP